jgi:hypothetical protein
MHSPDPMATWSRLYLDERMTSAKRAELNPCLSGAYGIGFPLRNGQQNRRSGVKPACPWLGVGLSGTRRWGFPVAFCRVRRRADLRPFPSRAPSESTWGLLYQKESHRCNSTGRSSGRPMDHLGENPSDDPPPPNRRPTGSCGIDYLVIRQGAGEPGQNDSNHYNQLRPTNFSRTDAWMHRKVESKLTLAQASRCRTNTRSTRGKACLGRPPSRSVRSPRW